MASPLSVFVDQFGQQERPVGTVVPDTVISAMAVAATNRYLAFSGLALLPSGLMADANSPLTVGEWSLIRPLFLLYLERENAIYLESTRVMGMDVFGRSVAEITTDIMAYEAELPHLAFSRPIISI